MGKQEESEVGGQWTPLGIDKNEWSAGKALGSWVLKEMKATIQQLYQFSILLPFHIASKTIPYSKSRSKKLYYLQ